jgi:putative FmdB family regulatory protein
MPTYEYRCAKCGEQLEAFQSFSDKPLTKHDECGGKLARVMSPAGIVLKGSGFYKTDSRSSAAKRSKAKSSEKSDSSSSSGSSSDSGSSGSDGSSSKADSSSSSSSSSDSSSNSSSSKSDSKPAQKSA